MAKKPVFGTKEWASSNVNILNGCQHDCLYCYAKAMSCRQGRKIENWKTPTLRKHMLEKGFGKRKGTIMFPTTHDIHPDNINHILDILEKMLKPGNDVLIVSKPHIQCITAICKLCEPYKNQILFRFTIGSADYDILKFWEPNAPSFNDRLTCLQYAFDLNFKTSVSCEPMLDDNITTVITKVEDYVTDAIWLGKANFLIERLKINGLWDNPFVKIRAKQLIDWQSDDNIRKLYKKYKTHPKIKWKESIKKVVGIEVPLEAGLDI
jgi:DNA repair photolyase